MAKRKLDLKKGCWVQLRKGWIVGPLKCYAEDIDFPWYIEGINSWRDSGRAYTDGPSPDDIMAVVSKPGREA